jgi:protein SCO1/2
MHNARFGLFVALLPILFFAACAHQPNEKRYPLDGRVVAVDAAQRQLTIAHHDVPGLMKGMTMPFVVSTNDAWIFQAIAPVDQVHATLVLGRDARLQDISFSKVSDSSVDGTSALHIPEPGQQVPDLTLINQDGHKISLNQFRGQPLLLTFIYTHCPFPDYCLRMSSNFAKVLRQLQQNPTVFSRAQLLSISIDPENDKPAVLRAYGESYVGRMDPKFAHWQFASGTAEQVRAAADFFGLAYNQKDGQIVHGLQTVLIGKDGTVLKVYSGNDWQPEDVVADYSAAASAQVKH